MTQMRGGFAKTLRVLVSGRMLTMGWHRLAIARGNKEISSGGEETDTDVACTTMF